MNFLPEEIEHYAERHTQIGPEYLDALSRATWTRVVMPRMLSGHLQGRFLSMISHMIKPNNILEIGTFTGYSALCLAEGLQPDGKLITIDINDELQAIQDQFFGQSVYGEKITRLFGNALDLIPKLTESFDLVFVDADKENYVNYYQLLMQKLPSGAHILFDNVLWSGKVVGEASTSDFETQAIQQLNETILSDNQVENVLLPLRDGIMMVRVR